MRLWRGRVASADAAEYEQYQREVGPPGYRVIPGNVGIFMLGQDWGDQYEIAMLTLWESKAAIRAFAGDPIDKARYYERDFEYLIEPPKQVEHFDVARRVDARPGARILRLWRGPVDTSRLDQALQHEAATGLPGYQRHSGNLGVYLAFRRLENHSEVAMVTLWDSLQSIRAFAGDPPEQANYDVYQRSGHDDLLEIPERAEHFEVLEAGISFTPEVDRRASGRSSCGAAPS